jgi:hypothetical protein
MRNFWSEPGREWVRDGGIEERRTLTVLDAVSVDILYTADSAGQIEALTVTEGLQRSIHRTQYNCMFSSPNEE